MRVDLKETLPEWRNTYLCYKPLKKFLKHPIPKSTTVDSALNPPPANWDDMVGPMTKLQDWFIDILNHELEKFNDFYLDKKEEFIIPLQVIRRILFGLGLFHHQQGQDMVRMDIKALFPPDRNPFYAGFGNRDTDEFSYLKVGIPIGKIFIINPKGQIVVNHRVGTKSYTSFHALVNDMFRSRTSSGQEDFNSWNFWKLPPADVDF